MEVVSHNDDNDDYRINMMHSSFPIIIYFWDETDVAYLQTISFVIFCQFFELPSLET
jgi:hypothetical protein